LRLRRLVQGVQGERRQRWGHGQAGTISS
jgi:hypothetical protein